VYPRPLPAETHLHAVPRSPKVVGGGW
jgi:hypothetical protein